MNSVLDGRKVNSHDSALFESKKGAIFFDNHMKTRLRLFLDWGITFDEPYQMPERANRKIAYANKEDLVRSIKNSGLYHGSYNTRWEGDP